MMILRKILSVLRTSGLQIVSRYPRPNNSYTQVSTMNFTMQLAIAQNRVSANFYQTIRLWKDVYKQLPSNRVLFGLSCKSKTRLWDVWSPTFNPKFSLLASNTLSSSAILKFYESSYTGKCRNSQTMSQPQKLWEGFWLCEAQVQLSTL